MREPDLPRSIPREGGPGAARTWPRDLMRRGYFVVQRVIREPRLFSEVAWVVLGRISEFILLFISLKIMTSLMPQAQFGVYQLIQSVLMLLGIVLLGPMQQGYQRFLHTAEKRGEQRAAGMTLLRWYATATTGILLLSVLMSVPIARYLEVGIAASILSGLVFFFDRWRSLALEILEIRRFRRQTALQVSGHLLLQIALLAILMTLKAPTAATALSAQVAAALVFGVIAFVPLLRTIISSPPCARSDLIDTVRRFGLPYSILLICQWLQFSADRFMIDHLMDKSSVGLYVAAYQVCGVPFMLMINIGTWLLVPIAYQRATDITQPSQLWAADKILIGGIVAYSVIGLVAVSALALVGPHLIVLLTSPEYDLPLSTIIALAVGRYVQCLTLLIQPIFAVHQKMTSSLAFRVIGSMLAAPACWLGVKWAGLFGAAIANVIVGLLFSLLLIAGPNGCLWLILRNRAQAIARNSQ